MKNKKVTYLLLGSVALVWGLIVYRIIAGMSDTDDVPLHSTKKDIAVFSEKKELRTLSLNYTDPFLKGGRGLASALAASGGFAGNIYGGHTPSQRRVVKKVVKPDPKPVVVPVVIDWSFISYVGLIGNRNSAQKIGLLLLHSKEHVVKEKDIIEGVSIVKLSKDTLVVNYSNTKHAVIRGR